MDSNRIQSHLDALGLTRDTPPDATAWRALLERLAEERLDAQIRRHERFLEAVVEMQTRLLSTAEDRLGAYNHALAPLGEAAGASRVYLFENHRRPEDGALLLSQRAEWCAPGVQPEIDNPVLQGLPYDDFVPEWAEALGRGELIERLASSLTEAERGLLEPQGVLSLLVLPLTVDGSFTGFIGFDNCTCEARWSPIEVSVLSAAANQIGLVLAQRRAQRQLQRANDEVVAARDRAVQANRAKSIFLAKMSHELRTPLNAIIGYSELLRETPEEFDAGLRDVDLERIQSAGHHLLAIIDDLLDLSRAEADRISLRLEPVDLAALLDDLICASQHLARRNGNELVAEIPGELGPLFSDHTRVHQVLLNLLSNACRYTSGGRITLTVEPSAEAIDFRIQDTGIGIHPAQLERIFDAFAQADDSTTRNYGGAGLGLTISRHLSQLLGGALTVTSALGHGSTFSFHLPRQPPSPAQKGGHCVQPSATELL